MTETVTFLDMSIEVEITSFYAGCRAKTNCLPEDSYPEEGPEIEWVISEDQDYAEFIQSALDNNDEMLEKITEQLLEQINNRELEEPY